MDLAALAKAKQVLGAPAFEAQYQQDPTLGMGCLYRPEYFPRYESILPRGQYEFVIVGIDTASSLSEDRSHTALVVCGVTNNQIHVLHVHRGRMEYDELQRITHKAIDVFAPSHIIIENTSLGTALLQALKQEIKLGVHGYKPSQNKVAVAESFLDIVTAKRVYLPKAKKWLKAFEEELFSFPGAPFNDQVDALNLVLRVVRHPAPALQKIRYTKQPSQMAYPCPKHDMLWKDMSFIY